MVDLMQMRRRMMLNMEKEEYIVFADPVVEQICATNWGDGVGITPSQARRVTNLGGVFQNNTQIASFDELEYFTGLTILNYYANTAYGTFRNCTNLKSVVLPSSVKTLYSTFTGCSNLESVGSLENVETLTNNAFYGCSKLAIDVYMPNLRSISTTAFQNTGITKISSLGNLTSIPSASGNYGVFRGCTHLAEVVLPSGLTSIGNNAFYGCSSLSNLTLPQSLTAIGSSAFYNCTELGTVQYSGTGNFSVASQAFRYCKKLVSFPTGHIGSMTGEYTFHRHIMTHMEFNSSLSTIVSRAFISLLPDATEQIIIMRETTPPTLGNAQVFHRDNGGGSFYINSGMKIYVPYSADHSILDTYKATGNWTTYANYIYELDANGNIPT